MKGAFTLAVFKYSRNRTCPMKISSGSGRSNTRDIGFGLTVETDSILTGISNSDNWGSRLMLTVVRLIILGGLWWVIWVF